MGARRLKHERHRRVRSRSTLVRPRHCLDTLGVHRNEGRERARTKTRYHSVRKYKLSNLRSLTFGIKRFLEYRTQWYIHEICYQKSRTENHAPAQTTLFSHPNNRTSRCTSCSIVQTEEKKKQENEQNKTKQREESLGLGLSFLPPLRSEPR